MAQATVSCKVFPGTVSLLIGCTLQTPWELYKNGSSGHSFRDSDMNDVRGDLGIRIFKSSPARWF